MAVSPVPLWGSDEILKDAVEMRDGAWPSLLTASWHEPPPALLLLAPAAAPARGPALFHLNCNAPSERHIPTPTQASFLAGTTHPEMGAVATVAGLPRCRPQGGHAANE